MVVLWTAYVQLSWFSMYSKSINFMRILVYIPYSRVIFEGCIFRALIAMKFIFAETNFMDCMIKATSTQV